MVEAPELHVAPGFDSRHLHHTSLFATRKASRGKPITSKRSVPRVALPKFNENMH